MGTTLVNSDSRGIPEDRNKLEMHRTATGVYIWACMKPFPSWPWFPLHRNQGFFQPAPFQNGAGAASWDLFRMFAGNSWCSHSRVGVYFSF